MKDILILLSDVRIYQDLVLIVAPVTAIAALYLWYRVRGFRSVVGDVIEYGVYCSTHQTVNAGDRSDYFDSDIYLSEPKNVGTVLHWFQEEISRERSLEGSVDRLAFIEKESGPVGALTLKDLLTYSARIPSVVVRPQRRGPALQVKFFHEGLVHKVDRRVFAHQGRPEHVILVSDVATTGTTILESVDFIERGGGAVKAAFVIYDRQEATTSEDGNVVSAKDKLASRGIRLVSMINASEIKEATTTNSGLRRIAAEKGLVCKA